MTTLLDKIWTRHVVHTLGEECLMYVDRNFVHEESTQAFEALATEDPRKSQVVELRFFGGLGVEETAEVLGVSSDTAPRALWAFE